MQPGRRTGGEDLMPKSVVEFGVLRRQRLSCMCRIGAGSKPGAQAFIAGARDSNTYALIVPLLTCGFQRRLEKIPADYFCHKLAGKIGNRATFESGRRNSTAALENPKRWPSFKFGGRQISIAGPPNLWKAENPNRWSAFGQHGCRSGRQAGKSGFRTNVWQCRPDIIDSGPLSVFAGRKI